MNNIRDHFNLEKNYYILKNELDEFNVEITSKIDISSNKIQSYHLYLGGLKQDCINITIFPEDNNINLDDRFKEYYPEYYKNFNEKHKIGLLYSIEYDKKCNKMDNLVICVGTQNLIKSAIQVVCHEFPWVEKLRFQDSSSKKCGNKSEIISLSDLIIATQGKTWYEKHYNDYLEDAKLNSDYHSYLFNMTKPHAKLDWHLFSTLVYSFQSNNLHKIIYKNSNTYLEFLIIYYYHLKTEMISVIL